MEFNSKEATDFMQDCIERWLETVGLDWDDIPPNVMPVLATAAIESFERYRAAMIEPGEEIKLYNGMIDA